MSKKSKATDGKIVAKCWDGAFRKMNLLENIENGATATVNFRGIEIYGNYDRVNDQVVFNKL